MKRFGWALMLAAMNGPVAAAWVVVNDHDEYVAYADPATIARNGDVVRMRDMIDLKAPRRSPYGVAHLSSLAHSEFDCLTPRVRTIAFALHAEPMGNGEVVEEVAPSPNWMPVFNGTLLALLRRFACG